jgi:hypothetical protein
MYHRGSAGSISYAEFRYLGKEGVLGRYSLHYHLCGDTMRGSSLIGVSIHHSKNRWLTVHGTNYLVVRDCVGYQSIGHGFFLEDGTEVYNVFDRNLACQALDGLPLPKQVLPFDPNEGAGFWFANAHNTFTRNVAVECRQYGFRYEATPKAGVIPTDSALNPKLKFGEPNKPFDLVMNVRQPDGSRKPVDIRTLPFIRFEDNETHSNGFWGLNLGLGIGGIGPDADNPHVIRNLKIWSVIGGYAVEAPNVLIDGMMIHDAIYAVRASWYKSQDYRNVVMEAQGTPIATLEQYLAHKSANGTARASTRLAARQRRRRRKDSAPPRRGGQVEPHRQAPADHGHHSRSQGRERAGRPRHHFRQRHAEAGDGQRHGGKSCCIGRVGSHACECEDGTSEADGRGRGFGRECREDPTRTDGGRSLTRSGVDNCRHRSLPSSHGLLCGLKEIGVELGIE